MRIYGERPPLEEAEALVRRRINTACRYERDGQDWRDRFTLRPAIQSRTPNIGTTPYGVRIWGVYLDGERPVGRVVTNYNGDRLYFRTYGYTDLIPDEEAAPPGQG